MNAKNFNSNKLTTSSTLYLNFSDQNFSKYTLKSFLGTPLLHKNPKHHWWTSPSPIIRTSKSIPLYVIYISQLDRSINFSSNHIQLPTYLPTRLLIFWATFNLEFLFRDRPATWHRMKESAKNRVDLFFLNFVNRTNYVIIIKMSYWLNQFYAAVGFNLGF